GLQCGGATRQASTGTYVTRSAERTRPAAPTWATQPIGDASALDTSAAGTTAMPATCATAISGIAQKFSASPATVTRENASAPTGNNISSAATEATTIVRAADRAAAASDRSGTAGARTAARMAKVAPKVRRKAGSATDSGSAAASSAAATAIVLSGGLR